MNRKIALFSLLLFAVASLLVLSPPSASTKAGRPPEAPNGQPVLTLPRSYAEGGATSAGEKAGMRRESSSRGRSSDPNSLFVEKSLRPASQDPIGLARAPRAGKLYKADSLLRPDFSPFNLSYYPSATAPGQPELPLFSLMSPAPTLFACNQNTNLCLVNFDNLPEHADVTDLYDTIKFADLSFPANSVQTALDACGSINQACTQAVSKPMSLSGGSDDLLVKFPNAVSGLSFNIASIDDQGVIAHLTASDGSTVVASLDVPGNNTKEPLHVNLQSLRIKEVRITGIRDFLGLSYDDFSYSIILPGIPQNLRTQSVTFTQVSLLWDSAQEATSYEVQRADASGGPWTIIGTTTATSFIDNNVSPGNHYFYRVVAINLGGRTATNQLPVKTPLPAPTNLKTITFPSDPNLYNWVGFLWDTSDDVIEYVIKRTKTPGRNYEVVRRIHNTLLNFLDSVDTVTELDTSFYYVVSAVNGDIESPNSNEVEVKIAQTCGFKTFPTRPPLQQLNYFSWNMRAEVSDRDGLVLRDLSLNGRYISEMISVPYLLVLVKDKDGVLHIVRAELTPDNPDQTQQDPGTAELNPDDTDQTQQPPGTARSRLIDYNPTYTDKDSADRVLQGVSATYIIDHLFPGSVSCLKITQKYLFGFNEDGGCELSSTLPCARFYPKVEYQFSGKGVETFSAIHIPQRIHNRVENNPGNTVGVFRDCDTLPTVMPVPPFALIPTCIGKDRQTSFVFKDFEMPVLKERRDLVVLNGQNRNVWDNVHQTNKDQVGKPYPADVGPLKLRIVDRILGGCPECYHSHWRWSTEASTLADLVSAYKGRPSFGHGNLIGFDGDNSNQDMELAIVRYRGAPDAAHPNDEVHPADYASLLDNENLWQQDNSGVVTKQDTVLWYVTKGFNPSGSTFGFGAFANWNKGLISSNIQRGDTGGAGISIAEEATTTGDGPTAVTYEYGYLEGPTTFTTFDPSIVGPLPDGYTLLNNTGYEIKTETQASGNFIITFNVPSVVDQTAFNNLRILQAEPDPFNPDGGVWADHTILGPDPQAPDFTTRTIRVKTTHLGLFVIASLNNQTVNTKSADISVSAQASAAQLTAGNPLTYTVNVSNLGPDAATQVGLVGRLSADVVLVSTTPGPEACKFDDGAIYCQLGPLSSGATSTISVVVRPIEKSRNRFPDTGQTIGFSAFAAPIKEKDSNSVNNTAEVNSLALPDPNAPPEVKITSPADKVTFSGPANITVTAEASDSDGTISKVEFFGDGASIGVGELIAPGQYRVTWNNVGFGPRSVLAIATDNGGRQQASDAVIFLVNGPATVNMTSPAAGSFLTPDSTVAVTATAVNPTGSISKVEFYANERLIGEGTASGQQYSLSWKAPRGIYDLSAVATDNSGFLSFSSPVKVFVMEQANVKITEPLDFTSFSAQSVNFKAEVSNTGGAAPRKVEFFANGAVIGEGLPAGANLYNFLWLVPPRGFYSVVAVMTDAAGLQWVSAPINIAVDTPGLTPGDFIWVDDAVPQGAQTHSFRDDWYWVDSNPAAISGAKAHQSVVADGLHMHSFEAASVKMAVNSGEKLYAYVFLHPGYKPQEIMLEWKDGTGWDHRAFWSAQNVSQIHPRNNGDASSHWMGPLPADSRWVRLEVPAEAVGLAGQVVDGMAFDLYGGRATWDRVGKSSQSAPAQPPPGDTVWFDDSLPSGAQMGAEKDLWSWVNPPVPFSGLAHKTFQAPVNDDDASTLFRAHYFVNATQTLAVDPGDILFTYAYLDPVFTPDEIVVGWADSKTFYYAYWGDSHRGVGQIGTETMRYMGPIPNSGTWVRLEVPASYLGLEGKTIRGMYFGMNRQAKRGLVYWDKAGKSTLPLSTTIEPLHVTTPVYRFFNSDLGFSYFTNEFQTSGLQPGVRWYAHNNQAAGTVPFYRYRNQGAPRQYFYTVTPPDSQQNLPVPGALGWKLDTEFGSNGIAFYIYPPDKPAPPGTVPLYRFTNNAGRYFYSIFKDETVASGMTFEGPIGFVSANYPVFSSMDNPIDNPVFFVKQQYRDFLNREADLDGLNFWVGQITQCSDPTKRGANETESACVERKRVDVSAAFFLSIEFKDTGYLVYRLYNAALNRDAGLIRFDEFLADSAKIGDGVIVNADGWQQKLEANKVAFINEFVARDEFLALYPETLSPDQYVDALYSHARITPSPDERQADISEFAGASTSGDRGARARVLRRLAEGSALDAREINRAFVLMQYFGYLRRNPSDPPDNDLSGYNFWLTKLNQFNGDWRAAEMVKAFISSTEYRARFGQPVTPTASSTIKVGAAEATAGAISVTFSSAGSDGTLNVKPIYPAYLAPPPDGYAFYDNLAWDVSTTSSVTGPLTLKVSLGGVFNDSAEFANLRLLHLEDGRWVDRTISAPDFNSRSISASVNSLAPIAIARPNNIQPPRVNITTPLSGQSYTSPASITITANASSPTGSVTKVEFMDGDSVLGEDTQAPFSFSWNNVPAGNHVLMARVTDSNGASSVSPAVNISVNDLPAVLISAPAQNAVFNYPTGITITAYANDSNGIKQVEFFQGATSLGVATSAPYGVSWNSAGIGTYTLTAVATDNLNATMTSAPVTITVTNPPPVVAITSPASGTLVGNAPASIVINASASDNNGIKQVEFFQGATSLGVDTTAPYSFTWNNVAVGTYTLTARATDNLNATTTSSAVNVVVGNAPPTVSITSPINGSRYNGPTNLVITATAADNEGVKKVEFFQGSAKLGEVTTAPYSFTWSGVPTGTYSLTAKATDNLDAVTTSSPVSVSVSGPLSTLFSDDFNDNVMDQAKWYVTDPSSASLVAERNQRLELTPATASSVTAYNGYASVPFMDMTNAQVTVEVPQYAPSYGHETYFELTNSSGNYLLFDAGGGGLVLQDSVTGQGGRTVITAYNTTQHHFWRFRHDPATDSLLWETSSDGTAWITQRSIPRSFAITSMQVQLIGGKYAGVTASPATAVFDNLKVESPIPNNPPTVSISSPANGAVIASSAGVTINAIASDNDGIVTRVEFLAGTTSLGVAMSAPYSFTWNNAPAGTYNLTARATDNRGGITTSAPVSITVKASPAVSLTAPTDGTIYTNPATISLAANATAANGIAKVEFFQGGTLLKQVTTPPYSFDWVGVSPGNYTLTAKATDSVGTSTTSNSVNVTVNAVPTVALTAPTQGQVFGPAAAPIHITAAANDADGQIVKVEFFQGSTKLGESFAPPFSFDWQNAPAGSYNLLAKATDDRGATQLSQSISIRVISSNYTLCSDDFNDNSRDLQKWQAQNPASPVSVLEQNARLEITPPASTTGYDGYYAANTCDLTDARASVQVVQSTQQTYGIETYFELTDPANGNYLLFATGGPNFILQQQTNGVMSRVVIPFDPTQHRFWRFRHNRANDTIYWETSTDGATWTVQRQMARTFPLTNLQGILLAGKYTASTPTSTAIFDNYRIEPNSVTNVVFNDDFNDNARDAAKWNPPDLTSPATVAEQNNRLEITPAPALTGYNGYDSVEAYDMTGASVTAEVLQVTGGSADTMLRLLFDGRNYIQTVTEGGNIFFQFWLNNARTQTYVPYDPTQHHFWRIRHELETDSIVWETSPDGATWNVQWRQPRPMLLTRMKVQLFAGKWTNTNATTPGTAIFDNLKVERSPLLPPSDNFNDNLLDPTLWSQPDATSPVVVREQNQRLEMALKPNTAGYNSITSVSTFKLTDRRLQIEMPQVTNVGGSWAETYLEAVRDGSNYFLFVVTGAGTITFDAVTNGVRDRSYINFDPTAHRFWRLRHNLAANTMNFELSPNGTTWTTVKTVPVGFSLDSMRVVLQAGAWGTGNSTPGTAIFDNLRLEPNE